MGATNNEDSDYTRADLEREVASDDYLDFEVPRHRLTITKQQVFKSNHPNAGGNTQYPQSDTIYAEVIILEPGRGYQRQSFPFLRENTVASVKSAAIERFNNVLLSHGIELDHEANPVFDKLVYTFEGSGFSKGVVEDSLIVEPRFINGHPVGDSHPIESGSVAEAMEQGDSTGN